MSRTKQQNNRRKRCPPNKQPIQNQVGCGVCGIDHGCKYKCPKCRLPYCSVKCCKDHKLTCPALKTQSSSPNLALALASSSPSVETATECIPVVAKSNYLPSDALTADPLANARQRRQRLEEDEDNEEDDREGWRITREMMDRLDASSWLKTELSDGGLRQMIYEIDAAEDVQDGKQRRFPRKRKRNTMGLVPDLSERELSLERAKLTNPKFAKFVDKLLLEGGVLNENRGDEGDADQVLTSLLKQEDELGHLSLIPIEKRKRITLERTLSESSDESTSCSSTTSSSSG